MSKVLLHRRERNCRCAEVRVSMFRRGQKCSGRAWLNTFNILGCPAPPQGPPQGAVRRGNRALTALETLQVGLGHTTNGRQQGTAGKIQKLRVGPSCEVAQHHAGVWSLSCREKCSRVLQNNRKRENPPPPGLNVCHYKELKWRGQFWGSWYRQVQRAQAE